MASADDGGGAEQRRPVMLLRADRPPSAQPMVMARAEMEVPAGRFRNCHRVRVDAAEPYLIDFSLAPDVGIIG